MGRRRTRDPSGGREGGGQEGGFEAAFDAEVVHEIEALIAPGAADRLDFKAVETAVRQRALEARYVGRRNKQFTKVLTITRKRGIRDWLAPR